MSDDLAKVIAKLVGAVVMFFLNVWIVYACINVLPFGIKLDYGQTICLYIACQLLFHTKGGFDLKDDK